MKRILLSIGEGPYILGTTPPVALGSAYLAMFTAGGGRPPFTYSLLSGSAALSALGLAFTDNGDDTAKIDSAETTASGTAEFTVEVVDADRVPGVRTFRMEVIALPLTLSFTSLPDATSSSAYIGQVIASGGVTPYTYSLVTAPDWMTINGATGELGGTPDGGDVGAGITVTARAVDADDNAAEVTDTMDVAEGPSDPYWEDVVALLHGNGTDASTTFTDEVGNSWAANGTAQIDTGAFKYGDASMYFPQALDYIEAADSDNWRMGTADFTVEAWFRPTSTNGLGTTAGLRVWYGHGINTTGGLLFSVSNDQVLFRAAGTSDLSATVSLPNSSFTHIAFVREGTTRRIYVGGVQVTSGTLSFNNNDASTTLQIGSVNKVNELFRYFGWIDDLRITKGTCRYPGGTSFTPPTAELEYP